MPVSQKYCLTLFITFLFLGNYALQSQDIDWGNLETGEYDVGFKSFWLQDTTRTFTYNDDLIKRPLLVNIWYPSEHNKNKNLITQSDYFQIPDSDVLSTKISRDYKEYNLQILAYELFGKPLSNFSIEEKSTFEEFLKRIIPVQKESTPIKSKFPLIIYHQGFEASYEDNSVLMQFLASNGYVVIGSSFFSEDSFSVNGRSESVKDIHFLINFATKNFDTDVTNVALIGHSGGAQASILAKSDTDNVIKAVVAIETTQEMFGMNDSRWNDFTKPVKSNISNMNTSLLAFTNHMAVFQLYDLMLSSDRIYITFPASLSHNEYISQGIFANVLKQKMASTQDKSLAYFLSENEDATNYIRVNQFILEYLEWKMKSKESFSRSFKASDYILPIDFDKALISSVPKGKMGPTEYEFHSNRPLSPRQVWQSARLSHLDSLISTLDYFYKQDRENPIYHDLFAFSLITELIEENKLTAAKILFNFYRSKHIPVVERFLSISRFSLMMRKPEYSKRSLLNLLKVDPENIEAKEALRSTKY